MLNYMNFGKYSTQMMRCRSPIPLMRTDCNPRGEANRNLSLYLELKQQKLKEEQEKKKLQASLKTATKFEQKLNLLTDFMKKGLPNIHKGEGDESSIKRKKYVPEECTRISPEFLELLQRHAPPQQIDPKHTTPVKVEPNKGYQFNDPTRLDHTNPMLAAYLRSVMKGNDTQNYVYGIDFYDNYDPVEIAALMALDHMNFNELGMLMRRLMNGEILMPNDMGKIQAFLQSIANLSPSEMRNYLKMLQNAGVLTPDMLEYMRKIMTNTALALSDAQIQFLLDGLQAVTAPSRPAKLLDFLVGLELDLSPSDLAQIMDAFEKAGGFNGWLKSGLTLLDYLLSIVNPQLRKLLRRSVDYSDLKDKLNEFGSDSPRLGSYEMEPVEHSSIATDERDSQTIDPTKKKMNPFKWEKSGYYKPWDPNIHIEELEPLRRKSTMLRQSRVDMSNFEYKRGFEYYVHSINNPPMPEPPPKMKKHRYASLSPEAYGGHRRKTMGLRSRKSHYGHFRNLPSFMHPARKSRFFHQ